MKYMSYTSLYNKDVFNTCLNTVLHTVKENKKMEKKIDYEKPRKGRIGCWGSKYKRKKRTVSELVDFLKRDKDRRDYKEAWKNVIEKWSIDKNLSDLEIYKEINKRCKFCNPCTSKCPGYMFTFFMWKAQDLIKEG